MPRFAVAVALFLAACSEEPGSQSHPPPPERKPAESGAPALKEAESAPPARLDIYRLSGPRSRANLAVYLLHDKTAPAGDLGCLSLEEAQRSGAVKVSEKAEGAEVNELQVENTGDKPVYLQAGDTVKGGQQDRTIAVDFVLPANSGKRTVDAFCVEPGRWSVRNASASQLGVATAATFAMEEAPTPVATREQKLAVRLSKSQEEVWEAGRQVNGELKAKVVSASAGGGTALRLEEPKNSFVEAVEDPAVAKRLEETVAALSTLLDGQADAVGAAFCINGKVQSVEIYQAAGLFRKLWPKLLRAAAVEALAKSPEGEPARPPAEAELRAMLAGPEGHKGRMERRPDGPVVRVFELEHLVLFDTESGGKLLHRQLLPK
jgi:hypothetical protein